MRRRLLALALAAAFAASSAPARAMDLLAAVRAAAEIDPVLAAARAQLAAVQERVPQARAALGPTVNATASAQLQRRSTPASRPPATSTRSRSACWRRSRSVPPGQPRGARAERAVGAGRRAPARAGPPGHDPAGVAGLLRRARRAGQPVGGARPEAGLRRAVRVGAAQLRGRHRDDHRPAGGAVAARPDARPGSCDRERPRGPARAARAAGRPAGARPVHAAPRRAGARARRLARGRVGAIARAQNNAVRQAELSGEIAKREIERQRYGHYPTLDAVVQGTYGRSTNAALNPALSGVRTESAWSACSSRCRSTAAARSTPGCARPSRCRTSRSSTSRTRGAPPSRARARPSSASRAAWSRSAR
jgi:outer membrane protein